MLICPGCQADRGWANELDRCGACESAALVCRLGEVECRDCGHTREAVRDDLVRAAARSAPEETGDRDLSAEVAAALSRVLSRGPAG
ncbi:hypothetical protein [Actinomadura sp. CNU-125]|uniref:hypothetical protein n=1 Tax=Actinomadura sp. CNU-125 TaxID=1904961 RepID=UPI0021CD0D6A|nr:hypothetical protein [Actinomadura sp. CNU-125]